MNAPATVESTATVRPAAAPDPWAIISEAVARIGPDAPEALRLAISRALGAVGIPELARLWADTIPTSSELGSLADQIRDALPGLPPSRIDQRTMATNVADVMERREDVRLQLGTALAGWQEAQRIHAWFQANDGRIVVFDTSRAVDCPSGNLRIIGSPASVAARSMITNEGVGDGPPAPVVLDGLESAASVLDLSARLPRLANGAWARIYVVESDPSRVLDALGTGELSSVLDEERVRLFVGPDAEERLIAHLRDARDEWASLTYLAGDSARTDTPFRDRLLALPAERAREYQTLCAENNARYAGRDTGWWHRRYRAALSGEGRPLRFLVPTTRYSTYIRHASADIASALEGRGFEARLLIEPDDSSLREGLSLARAVQEFEPDALILTNYTRSTLGDSVPSRIPHVCWIQDELSHLFTDRFARDVDPLTMLVGNIYMDLIRKRGVPADRCLVSGVPASAAKFRADIIDRPRTDLLIVTNHGETPEAMRDRLEAECVEAGGPPSLVPELYAAAREGLRTWRRGYLVTWLRAVLAPICECHGINPAGSGANDILRDAAVPLVNRILRHRMIDWAIDLAESEGLSLRLAGRGWDRHPRATQYWVGEVAHGPDLRDAYRDAAITMQSSAAALLHQRVHECLLAGSMPALMMTPDDLFAILRPARVGMFDRRPSCSTVHDRKMRVRVWDDPVIALSLATAQRVAPPGYLEHAETQSGDDEEALALETGMLTWRWGTDVPRPSIREAVPHTEQARFIDAISPGLFSTADQLRKVVLRAKADPGWRRSHVEHARRISERSFTYEHACGSFVSQLSEQLGRESGRA
ncbi:MAG: hypothetical protein AAGA55_05495 [Planctomycetota bacterium]